MRGLRNDLRSNHWRKSRLCGLSIVGLVSLALLLPSYGRLKQPQPSDPLVRYGHKISPLLKDAIHEMDDRSQHSASIPVIVKVERDFFAGKRSAVVEPEDPRRLSLIDSYALELPADQIRALLASDVIEYITIDAEVQPTGKSDAEQEGKVDSDLALLATIGADQATAALVLQANPTLTPSQIKMILEGQPASSGRTWPGITDKSAYPVTEMRAIIRASVVSKK